MSALITPAIVDFSMQAGFGAVAILLNTEKFYDLVGSSTFLVCTGLAYRDSPRFLRQSVLAGSVSVWALRLGSFLFTRVLKDGEDKRFRIAKKKPLVFSMFWFLQGVWVLVTLAPILLALGEKSDVPIGAPDYAGWAIAAAGLAIEVISDSQKSAFRAKEENKRRFISSGLWSISRHPNYFGEMLFWTGLFIASTPVLNGAQYMSGISPLFVGGLITFVSGIPILEKMAKKRWGEEAEYKEYVRKTAILIPYLY
eukprot:m.137671 g.137671  ORF g.137671 m.137671 type:complete len:254 (-) comp14757_c1_seq6:115-876(-)